MGAGIPKSLQGSLSYEEIFTNRIDLSGPPRAELLDYFMSGSMQRKGAGQKQIDSQNPMNSIDILKAYKEEQISLEEFLEFSSPIKKRFYSLG